MVKLLLFFLLKAFSTYKNIFFQARNVFTENVAASTKRITLSVKENHLRIW